MKNNEKHRTKKGLNSPQINASPLPPPPLIAIRIHHQTAVMVQRPVLNISLKDLVCNDACSIICVTSLVITHHRAAVALPPCTSDKKSPFSSSHKGICWHACGERQQFPHANCCRPRSYNSPLLLLFHDLLLRLSVQASALVHQDNRQQVNLAVFRHNKSSVIESFSQQMTKKPLPSLVCPSTSR